MAGVVLEYRGLRCDVHGACVPHERQRGLPTAWHCSECVERRAHPHALVEQARELLRPARATPTNGLHGRIEALELCNADCLSVQSAAGDCATSHGARLTALEGRLRTLTVEQPTEQSGADKRCCELRAEANGRAEAAEDTTDVLAAELHEARAELARVTGEFHRATTFAAEAVTELERYREACGGLWDNGEPKIVSGALDAQAAAERECFRLRAASDIAYKRKHAVEEQLTELERKHAALVEAARVINACPNVTPDTKEPLFGVTAAKMAKLYAALDALPPSPPEGADLPVERQDEPRPGGGSRYCTGPQPDPAEALTAESVAVDVRDQCAAWGHDVSLVDAIALIERYAQQCVVLALSHDGADATRANMQRAIDEKLATDALREKVAQELHSAIWGGSDSIDSCSPEHGASLRRAAERVLRRVERELRGKV